MSYATKLLAEIDTLLDEHEAARRPLEADEITKVIMRRHEDAYPGEISQFWRFTAHQHVRDQVGRRISTRSTLSTAD